MAVKMESFVVAVAPPEPRLNVSATSDGLKKSPQLYFQVKNDPLVFYQPERKLN
jgi:hypothetical protein